jgi:hypothetical protein
VAAARGVGRTVEGNRRAHEVGSDERQLLAGAHRFRQIAGGESAAKAAPQPRQCRKDDGGACNCNSRLRLSFYDYLPRLYPAADAKSWFAGKKEHADTTAFRNGSLQGGYFILAARALGLDCGPMSGFNNAGVDAEFFPGTDIKSNFLCNLAYGDQSGVYPRSPRFSFDEMARII